MSNQAAAFTPGDYARFLASGGLCATLTHGAMTPIDVVKTRIQLEPKGSRASMVSMATQIVKTDGPGGLLAGFGPTAVGYLIQGGLKFAGYEFFKEKFVQMVGGPEAAVQYRQPIYIGGAAAAEVIATTALTPLEAARIRLVSERGYAKGLVGAITRMAGEQGIGGFYAGYIPILCKQVPYAVGQFFFNELAHETVKTNESLHKLAESGKAGQLTANLGCGIFAGVAAAVLSHPGDTLLSKINKSSDLKGSSIQKLGIVARETGFTGLWAGLGTRTLMTCFLVAGQFAIYDEIKRVLGAPKGIEIVKSTSAQ